MTKCITILSGGADSTTLLVDAVDKWGAEEVTALSFDYGQRHARELDYASYQTGYYHVDWHRVDLRSVNELIQGSALTDDSVAVPEGHYTASSQAQTVVPNRNSMMLNIAIAHAVATSAEEVRYGAHWGDRAQYPDCREEFVAVLTSLAHIACQGFINPKFEVAAPFIHMSKADIVRRGEELNVDWARTYSCYRGEATHCGRCGTCLERVEAFSVAGVADPTHYEDLSLYKELVAKEELQ